MTNATRLAFIKMFVNDLPAQADFFQSVFGFTEKARLSGGEGVDAFEEVILTSGRDDDSSLILWRFPELPVPTPGETVFGFNVADAHGTVQRIEQAGGSVVKPVKDMSDHGCLVAFAKDPEGHLMEIVQTL